MIMTVFFLQKKKKINNNKEVRSFQYLITLKRKKITFISLNVRKYKKKVSGGARNKIKNKRNEIITKLDRRNDG